jgi:PKD repeat protein
MLAMASHGIAADNQLLGWNNLGMHCMDSDYSVFSILPPYNTIEAQLIVGGKLVKAGTGYSVTYEAVADPSGSFNSTAMGKGNYYTYAHALFGATLAPEQGLAMAWSMPGTSNTPQGMLFETLNTPAQDVTTPVNWWRAEGIPISPYDDAHNKNPYPLMRLVARNASGTILTSNNIVLPVSDEMDCRACHASGTQAAAMPAAGWVWDGLQERDFRLNILRLHDQHQFDRHSALYAAALAARGFNSQGLYRGVVADGKPVLCAACHASEALGAGSYSTIPQLTTSVHAAHADVQDPILNTTLNDSANRAACYRCHPGSTTKCLRGAMGGAISADGSMEMQCQSCHGNMRAVGASNRTGWFQEPTCQNCHAGTANHTTTIRYTSAFDANGVPRVPADSTFATTPNTPAAGLSLYRFSVGHGGLQCSACHGSTHAEFPSSHANDNLRNIAIQGHAGSVVECDSCHVSMPASTAANVSAGPHGMHPIGQDWVSNHHDRVHYPETTGQCQACHGTDYRGSVLSRAHKDRSFSANDTTVTFSRGAQIGCYNCHLGPDEGNRNPSVAPTAANASANISNSQTASIVLPVSVPNLPLWIVSQPANGSVGLLNGVATYFPNPGFVGTDTFTYIANDGSKNSLIPSDHSSGTVTVNVAQGPISMTAAAQVPPSYPAGWPVAFAVVPTLTNSLALPAYAWDFGDGSVPDARQYPAHAYAAAGTYHWSVVVTASTASATASGSIVIGNAVALGVNHNPGAQSVTLSWPITNADTLLETSFDLGITSPWQWIATQPSSNGNSLSVTVPATDKQFFRIRRPW